MQQALEFSRWSDCQSRAGIFGQKTKPLECLNLRAVTNRNQIRAQKELCSS